MKTKILFAIALLTSTIKTYAASGIFGDPSQFLNEIKSYAPFVIVGIFIISGLFNLGNFFGENRDYKKGIYNIVGYVCGVTIFIAVVAYLTSLSIS